MSKYKVPVIIDETGARIPDLSQIPEIAQIETLLDTKVGQGRPHETFFIWKVAKDYGNEMEVEIIDGSTEEGRLRGCKKSIEEWIAELG